MKRKKSADTKLHKNKVVWIFILPAILVIGTLGVSGVLLEKSNRENLAITPTTAKTANVLAVAPVVFPKQYSDTHITENAIATDPQFKNIAISETSNDSNLANVVSVLQNDATTTESSGPENGTWLWTPVMQITPAYADSIISGAKQNGIKNIYVSIDSYLDIFVMASSTEKDAETKQFGDILENFITDAHQNGMTVDAEGGWENWAEAGNTYKAYAVVDYAMEFNKTHTEKFRGFQYDVEPYLLDNYAQNKSAVLKDYVGLVNGTVAMMSGSDLQLSVVIPEFYDDTEGQNANFTYGGTNGDTLDHLLDVLEQRQNSKIIVMAYRNTATGDNGSVNISEDEIAAANKYDTKVIIAQETGDVEPPYITFYNTSKADYDSQVATIEQTFAGDKSYGGIATHYINAFLALK